jgi:hypothetical protein
MLGYVRLRCVRLYEVTILVSQSDKQEDGYFP